MPLNASQKSEIVEKYGKDGADTGSTSVQVALLTKRIDELSQHLQNHTKDHHGRRGLLMMVGKRKRLLSYLERTDYDAYKELIQSLGLRR
jgi:small subunit ribosomal protein S15